ncbi:nicotinate phosphoribosyltransferase [Micromonospora inositola]|uniref:nicotinate phosphoribosyltransferase n=1 Tax=Micromonospora inositola TaxID=47865 RepID=A0A1C5HF17_9ACTN|nr:nicotinate phosphoribosyltransferase [Micromonospora inositola]SCG44602.1 nicotinate phosphoribosyltransferase [Micromonospora inositola]
MANLTLIAVRRLPPQRGFLVAAGLAEALAFLEGFDFAEEDLGYLRDVGFDQSTLEAFARLRFTGDVWAVPEGRVVFADEPLLEVTAPIAEAQLVETGVLNLITFHTTVATKPARCRLAAGHAQVIDFAFRRTHGIDAGAAVARASAIAGLAATSHVEAARRYGLRPSGTMAHSYVEAFPDERTAFRAFATDFPTNAAFLVDTHDTPAGVRAAVDVIPELGLTGPVGARLDSGDLATLAVQARAISTAPGCPRPRSWRAAASTRTSSPRSWPRGRRSTRTASAPAWASRTTRRPWTARTRWWRSATDRCSSCRPARPPCPGPKQVFRDPGGDSGDVVGLRDEPPPGDRPPLLAPVMRDGRRVGPAAPPGEVRERHRFDADLAWLPEAARRLADPTPLTATVSPALTALHRWIAERMAPTSTGAVRRNGR